MTTSTTGRYAGGLNPFPKNIVSNEISSGNGTAWPQINLPLDQLLILFYQVRNFTVILDSSSGGAIGWSKRRIVSPPQILNDIQKAFLKQAVSNPNPLDVKAYNDLKTGAIAQGAAPGESKTFLRALDINVQCDYPIHFFSGKGVGWRMDFGSLKNVGAQTYNVAMAGTTGTEGQTTGGASKAVGVIYLHMGRVGDTSAPAYSSIIYGGAGDGEFGNGHVYINEMFSDLVMTPASGPSGTSVNISTDPTQTTKTFSGFHTVKKVSYNGFNVPFSFTSSLVGKDARTQKDIINETCSVSIPQGARSSVFTFYCENSDGGTTTYDIFSTSTAYKVTN